METDPDQRFFRIVIGCYRNSGGHWSARDALRADGLDDDQICSLGSRRALMIEIDELGIQSSRTKSETRRLDYDVRHVRCLEIHVSSATLFDRLWPAPHHHDGSLTRWMTSAQSDVVWRKLVEHRPLLLVSANSAQQQIRSVQVQFRHDPMAVQAFNFAV